MAFPTTGLIDSFNRADENPVSDGGKWTSPAFPSDGNLQVITSQLGTVSSWCSAYRNDITPGPDSEAYLTVVTVSGGVATELLLRLANPGVSTVSGYMMDVTSGGTWSLWKIVNNVQTQIGSNATQVVSNGDSIGFEIIGSTLKGYYKSGAGAWTQIITVTDATHSGAGRVGIAGNGGLYRWDDFGGGTVTVAVAGGGALPRPLLMTLGHRLGLRLPVPARAARPGPVIATTPVSASSSDPIESAQAVAQAAADPVETAQAVAASAADPVEAGQGIASPDAAVIEAAAGVASSAAAPLDAAAGIASSSSDPVEAAQALAPAGAADPLESGQAVAASTPDPVEAAGAVASAASDPIEARAGVGSAFSDPLEAGSGVAQTVAAVLEALQGVASAATDPLEASGNTPVSQTSAAVIEAVQAVAAALTDPVEATQALPGQTSTAVVEALQGVVGALSAPLEAARGVAAVSVVPLESGAQIVAAVVAPIEALQAIIAALTDPIEASGSGFVAISARPGRATVAGYGAAIVRIRILDADAALVPAGASATVQ